MANKRWFVFVAVLAIACSTDAVNDKRIRLEDIEQDNLRSEAELMTKGPYLKPPSIDAERTADYGPPQKVYTAKQYAVEEDPSTDVPSTAYASNNLYYAVDQKDLTQQATSSSHNPLQTTYLGYVPAMSMHLVYVPQVEVTGNAGSTYPKHYHSNVPAIVYQPIVTQEYAHAEKQQYPSGKGYDKVVASTVYDDQSTETEIQGSTGYVDQPKYVYVSQTYQQEQPQYTSYADEQYTTDDNSISYNKVNTGLQAPSAPYRTYTPKYTVATPSYKPTKIAPPPLAFYPTEKETPKVLAENAKPVSKPIYSHISGNLGLQDNSVTKHTSHKDYLSYNPYGKYSGQYSTIYGSYKPKSLLDSYIPSSLQIEYLRRGLSKEPLATYDLIANSRTYRLEGGFLPNQLYTTGNGGAVYGEFKRSTN